MEQLSDGALRRCLESLTELFATDSQQRTVCFLEDTRKLGFVDQDEEIHVAKDPSEVFGIDISELEEHDVRVDIVSHETEHALTSDLNAKEEFSESNPEYENAAGDVINIIEDRYIDARRLRRRLGIRSLHSKTKESIYSSHEPVSKQGSPEKYINGLIMLSKCGKVKGIESAEEQFVEFIGRVKPLVESADKKKTQGERWNLAQRTMDILSEYIEEDAADTVRPSVSGSASGEGSGGTSTEVPAPEPEDVDTDRVIEELECDDPEELVEDSYESDVLEVEERIERQQESSSRNFNRGDRDRRIGKTNSISLEEVEKEYQQSLANDIKRAFNRIKNSGNRARTIQKSSHIHMRTVLRNRMTDGYSDPRRYVDLSPAERGDRSVVVCLDASGSMDEKEAKMALLAIARATEYINDDFASFAYTNSITNESKSQLITGLDETFKLEHLDSFNTSGGTPTASGIKSARELFAKTQRRKDKIMIVVTDGRANISLDSTSNSAVEDTNRQIGNARRDGITVIGLGVGNVDHERMTNSFSNQNGKNYFTSDQDNLADEIIRIYADQMSTASRSDVVLQR